MKGNISKAIVATLVFSLMVSQFSVLAHAGILQAYATSADVLETIGALNKSEDGIPDSVTKDDIYKVAREGGTKGIKALLNIYESSTPVSAPIMNDEQTASESIIVQNERFSYVYDMETSEVSRVDGEEFSTPALAQKSRMVLTEPSSIETRRAYPTDWYTPNPQDYSDTRKTCKLIIVAEDMSTTYGGTGFLVSNSTVVTAGHCIYNSNFGDNGWCGYIIVIPSYSNSNQEGPYGSATDATFVEVGSGWVDSESWTDDWGIISLTDSFSIGYYTLLNAGENIVGWWVRIQGYEGNSKDLFNTGGNIVSVNGRAMRLTAESKPGMSGGPVSEDTNGYIIGINRGHYLPSGDAMVVRLDDWLYNKIMSRR